MRFSAAECALWRKQHKHRAELPLYRERRSRNSSVKSGIGSTRKTWNRQDISVTLILPWNSGLTSCYCSQSGAGHNEPARQDCHQVDPVDPRRDRDRSRRILRRHLDTVLRMVRYVRNIRIKGAPGTAALRPVQTAIQAEERGREVRARMCQETRWPGRAE